MEEIKLSKSQLYDLYREGEIIVNDIIISMEVTEWALTKKDLIN